VKAVAERVRRFDGIFTAFADGLQDFTPFVPLEGIIRFAREWARDGLLLIGDAAHTMSPAGAIGVNVALATAAVAAQEIYPRLGRGPIAKADLLAVQRVREADVRTLHRLQLGAQGVLLGQQSGNPVVRWLVPRALPWLLRSPLLPRIQRRIFFGAHATAKGDIPITDEGAFPTRYGEDYRTTISAVRTAPSRYNRTAARHRPTEWRCS
jgi:hypothetical protein